VLFSNYYGDATPSLAQRREGAKIAIISIDASGNYVINERSAAFASQDVEALIDDLDGNPVKNLFITPTMDKNDSIVFVWEHDVNDLIGGKYSAYDAVFIVAHGDADNLIAMMYNGEKVYSTPPDWTKMFIKSGVQCKRVDGCLDGLKYSGNYNGDNSHLRNKNLMRQAKP
jgi:hypothetical protein